MIMIKPLNFSISIILLCIPFIGNTQVTPEITARVDTTRADIKEIYNLFTNYLNSNPDSLYLNPYWNEKEVEVYLKSEMNFNRASWFMFNGFDSPKQFYSTYPPKVISIVKMDSNRYSIRSLYNNTTPGYENYNPVYITKLYAVKNKRGTYKLENTIKHDTRNWKRYDNDYIHYIVSPNCEFDEKDALKAIEFCKSIIYKFNLKETAPFTYYMTSNADEMGMLFNFDYWLSYSTGISNAPTREVYTSYGSAYFPHEFVHILLQSLYKNEGGTMLITEGIATWLGGPGFEETYKEALITFSNDIRNKDSISIDAIINNEYRNSYNNNPIYLTGAVICEKIYEIQGVDGIKRIFNTPKAQLKEALADIFERPYDQVDKMIMEYIKGYSFEWNNLENKLFPKD